jgi:hypothetical protein
MISASVTAAAVLPNLDRNRTVKIASGFHMACLLPLPSSSAETAGFFPISGTGRTCCFAFPGTRVTTNFSVTVAFAADRAPHAVTMMTFYFSHTGAGSALDDFLGT